MSGDYYVYSLIDPRPRKRGRVFYVGKGKGRRSKSHLRSALNGSHCNPHLSRTIKKINTSGLEYGVEFLFSSTNEAECFEKEIHWISFYGMETLCNLTEGGEGAVHCQETREKLRALATGRHPSAEAREKMSKAHKGVPLLPEQRERVVKMNEARRGTSYSPEHRANISKSNKEQLQKLGAARVGIPLSEETRKRLSEANKGKTLSPETKSKISESKTGVRINRKTSSGFKGVTWNKRREKWVANIWVNRANVFLGYFAKAEDGAKVREEADTMYIEKTSV